MAKTTERRRARLEAAAAEIPKSPAPSDTGRRLLRALLLPRLLDVYGPVSRPWPDDTRDLVHDTRVASRRFVEALELARPLLSEKTFRRAKRDAKALRRALGARREADVMAADLETLVKAAGLPPSIAEPVEAALTASGEAAFAEARAHWTPKRALKAANRVLEALDEPIPDLSWRDVGAPHLYDRANRPQARLPKLSDPAASPAHHALRVDFKHLRYATEILSEPFPETIDARTWVKELKALQDALGVLQDADDLLRFLEGEAIREATRPGDLARLRAEAGRQKATRHAHAEALVLARAPDLLGALRRASGKIGLFPRP
jgi:CHAD domain-containing protein